MCSSLSLRQFRTVLLGVLAVVVAVIGLAPAGAAAHTTFLSSNPADGAVLATAPTQVSMVFADSVPLDSATLLLIDAAGVRTELTPLRHGADDSTIVADLPALEPGDVTVRWTLVGVDGHVLTGRVAFTIAAAAAVPGDTVTDSVVPSTAVAATPPQSGTPQSGDIADDERSLMPETVRWLLRWASYVAIFLVVGLLVTDAFVWPGVAALPRWRPWLGRGLTVIAVLAAAQLMVHAGDLAGAVLPTWTSLDLAGGTDVGISLVVRILLAGAVWLLLRMEPVHSSGRSTGLVLAAGALLGTWAFVGHSRSMRWPWLGVPTDVAHHAAAAAWVGALAIIALDGGAAREQFTDVVRRLSRLAPAAVGLLVVTGVVQSVRLHGAPTTLLDTRHGALLLVKVALVVVMVALADRNRRALQTVSHAAASSATLHRLRRLMLVEFGVGVGVVGVTAALVASALR